MKKILYFIIGAMLLTSCEDFLDSSNKTKKDSSNFPQTEADVSQLLTGVYSILGRPEPLGSLFFVSELMSDDRLGGGGTDVSGADDGYLGHVIALLRSQVLRPAL